MVLFLIIAFFNLFELSQLICEIMENFAKIIHKTHLSYLPTIYPVQFYGMPNGKVFFIYARNTLIKSELEFIFAEHREFSYDYTNNKLMFYKSGKLEYAFNNEMIDKPDPKYAVIKISRNLRSYTDAYNDLNLMASEIIRENNAKSTILLNTTLGIKARSNVS